MTTESPSALAELEVADSHFLGFCFDDIVSRSQAVEKQTALKAQFPTAAHVPVVWRLPDGTTTGYEEDEEPPGSVGPGVVKLWQETEPEAKGMAIVIVRYFGEQLLGVTCGRLPQCYQSLARLTLHRHLRGIETPLEYEIPASTASQNVYGMAAGDCELILDVAKEETNSSLLDQVRNELDFGGFKGAEGEVLPRLQNLQADLSDDLVPVYRYPGNYSGQEWDTFHWAPKSLGIKEAVEQALQPLVTQTMNHCVTNYYRDGKDFIAHHSDKDLDLNRKGVIVSVSLGDERVLELRRRKSPKDIVRVALPHRSMLVLGPKTNTTFSHSILAKEASTKARISLTLRDVKTFLDLSSGRLFGQGVGAKSLSYVRSYHLFENLSIFGAFASLTAYALRSEPSKRRQGIEAGRGNGSDLQTAAMVGIFAAGSLGLKYLSRRSREKYEEREAREFFSKKSMSGTKY